MTNTSTINQLFLENMNNKKLPKFTGKYFICKYYEDNIYGLL